MRLARRVLLGKRMAQLLFFGILVAAFALLITERLRNDLVALLIIVALAVSGILTAEEALAGFSSEPAVVVAAIFVLSAGLHQTRASDSIGQAIGRLAGASFSRAVVVIMTSVAAMSAFTHHLTTTAVMLPVTVDLSRERGIAASKLLMPLSFGASLGTTITIIGAPAFLIASAVLQQAGRPGLGIFSIAPIGIALTIVGTAFVALLGGFLLPNRAGAANDEAAEFRPGDYLTELAIRHDSPYMNRTLDEIDGDDKADLNVRALLRNGERVPAETARGSRLVEGDVLLVSTTSDEIAAIHQNGELELNPIEKFAPADRTKGEAVDDDEDPSRRLVQTVVAPGSELVGRTLSELNFRARYGAVVLSLWRRSGLPGREMAKIRLRAGDVLVLHGDRDDLQRIADDRNFLLLMPFTGEARAPRKAWLAGAVMAATVAAAAFQLLTVEIAVVCGAVAMVLSRCLTPRQAYGSIDQRIFVFIAGAIPLGTAMTKVGASETIAAWLQTTIGGWSQTMLLMAIFLIVGVVTQLLSDAATTAVFAPVAVALAAALGQPPEPYVVTVAMGAVASFFTPIGHHGNLLIYGPGGYRFTDFIKVGTPLTLLVAIVVVLVAPLTL